MTFMIRFNLLLFLLLSSCTSISNIQSFYDLRSLAFGFPSQEITRQYFNEAKYSFATLRIGRGPESIIVLKEIIDNKAIWVSQDKITIITLNGRIVETIGLEYDYKELIYSESDRVVQYKNPNRITQQKVLIEDSRLESFNYFSDETKVKGNLIIERISNIGLKNQTNTYIDVDGNILLARQSLHPFYDEFKIKYYYKY